MLTWLLVLILSSAAIGWLTISIFISFLFRRISKPDEKTIQSLAQYGATQFSFQTITSKITDSSNFQLLTPELEQHMDTFLRVKLKESMPVVGMFIGDKTITQLKELFMKELEALFPSVMNSYLKGLEKDFNPEMIIREKLTAIPHETIKSFIRQNWRQEIKKARLMGTVVGLVVGILQSIFIFFVLTQQV